MKLTIERSALMKALSHTQSVVERRNTIPILSNVLLQAQEGNLLLTATDMDLDIIESAAANVSQTGSVTVPAHTLYDIVRKLPDGSQVDMDASAAGRMVVKAGRSRFTLATLPAEDFPAISSDDMPYSFAMPADRVRNFIDRTKFAISTEETRYYLNGIFLHATGANSNPVLRAVATDGHRLARVEMPMIDGANGMPGIIVPRKTVLELRKLVEETSEAIQISLSETRIRFGFENITLTSKLIDGTFPDYERVIPTENDKTLKVGCAAFAAAVDRVSTISTDKTRAIKLSIDNGSIVLTANSPDSGTATEELEASYSGAPVEIGFNSRYLLDITQQVTGGDLQMSLADGASPTVVQDPADAGALYVLMPMRV